MAYLLLVEAIFPKEKKNLVNSLNDCQHLSEFFLFEIFVLKGGTWFPILGPAPVSLHSRASPRGQLHRRSINPTPNPTYYHNYHTRVLAGKLSCGGDQRKNVQ